MNPEGEVYLERGARLLGLALTPGQIGAFGTLSRELLAWTQRVNLTAIRDDRDVEIGHFLDSLSVAPPLLRRLKEGPARGVDVGSGAGFPGLALKLALPWLDLTLVEATGKKVAFIEHVTRSLGLEGIRVIHGRSEPLAHQVEHRERYDFAVARAVGSAATLVELLVPLIRVGGWAVLMKTQSAIEEEMRQARGALARLNAEVEEVASVEIPGLLQDRALVFVAKQGPTPAAYPRRPGAPQHRPLR